MKPAIKISLLALLVALLSLGVAVIRPMATTNNSLSKKETTFARVMRTRTLRCGYAMWKPGLYKDMQTGAFHGFSYDIVEALGKKLDLKIDWAEEGGWGTIVEGLSTNRYDIICEPIARQATRAKVVDFSIPVIFGAIYMLTRAEDQRFTHNGDLNDPSYSIATIEGEAADLAVRQRFPKATIKALPPATDYTLIFQELADKKADAAVMELATFKEYEKTNPGKLKIVDINAPVLIMQMGLGLPQGDVALKSMLDVALEELVMDGTVEKAIRDNTPTPEAFFLPSRPYQISN